MRKNTILMSLGILLFSMFINACDSSGSGDSSGDKKPAYYTPMIERSLLSSGNNYRVKNVLEKAANGEEVTIAYIGGSITEGYTTPGDSYVIGSYDAFKEKFASGDGSHVHYINAGMGGTPSTVGMVRYKRDVLDKAEAAGIPKPDLVFVEFAVNDSDDPTNGASFESMVKDILEADNSPAVVLIFSVFQNQWNLQDRLAPIGTDYQLPMISIKDAIVPEINAGNMTNEEFFKSDELHPNTNGFEIMTDCVTNMFTAIDAQAKAESDITIPATATIGNQFCGIKMIDSSSTYSNVTINSLGSFSGTDLNMRPVSYDPDGIVMFPDNWANKVVGENNPFSMTLTCKNLVILYKISSASSFGYADVYVDGNLVESLDGSPDGAWNNPWTNVLIEEDTAAEHTVTIQMADANPNSYFTILAFGYTE